MLFASKALIVEAIPYLFLCSKTLTRKPITVLMDLGILL